MGSSWARYPPLPSSHFCWTSSRDVCVILQSNILKKKKKNHKQKLRKDSSSSSACVICVKTQLLGKCDNCRATAIRAACNCHTARHVWTNLPVIACRWCFFSIHRWSRLKRDRAFFFFWLEWRWDNTGTWGQSDRMSHTTLIVIMIALSRLTPLMLKGCSNSFSFIQWLAQSLFFSPHSTSMSVQARMVN